MKVVAYRRINGDSSLLMIWHFGVNGEGGGRSRLVLSNYIPNTLIPCSYVGTII